MGGGCGAARGGCDMRRLKDGCGCGAARGDCNWRRVKDGWRLRGGARRLRYAAGDVRRMVVAGWLLLPKDECAFETARGDCDMRRVRKDGAIAERLAAIAICGG